MSDKLDFKERLFFITHHFYNLSASKGDSNDHYIRTQHYSPKIHKL